MITQDLGIATAYGYAKSKGYTGTETEFAELMASYASTAQTAIEAADRAVEANTAAQSAKTDAAASKTAAQTAAQTATSKASEASQSASTATTKASEASQSASTASSAATSAGTSAQTATTAAATATTKASKAAASEAAALSAKTDAESARDAAAQSASEAAASAASIDPETLERKAYGAYVVESASGTIASFADGADDIPMKDVLVHIEPVQAGSGDPSPDNVRPISGWTAAKVARTGKNLLNNTAKSSTINGVTFTVNSDGTIVADGTATESIYFALTRGVAIPAGGYILTGCPSGGSSSTFSLSSQINNKWQGSDYGSGKSVSLGEDGNGSMGSRIEIVIVNGTTVSNLVFKPMLRLASDTDSTYEPYSGQTYDITFPSEAGTVYGGTLDVTSGVLTVDRAIIASYAGEILPSTWISDRDVYSAGATPTTGAQVVYELASTITYQLTPQEITSLLGTNNVWADTGDTEVEYRASTKMYIDKKITEAVSALS